MAVRGLVQWFIHEERSSEGHISLYLSYTLIIISLAILLIES